MGAIRAFVGSMVRLVVLLVLFGLALYGWLYDWAGIRTVATQWFTGLVTSNFM